MSGGAVNSNFGRAILQQSGMLGRVPGAMQQNAPQMPSSSPAYTPATPNVYNPSFSNFQTNQAPAPAMNAPAPAQQIQRAGLQALMANMMAQYPNVRGTLAMPQQGFMPQQAPMPMTQFRSPALNYRPNMAPAQASLGRVAVSVAEQQRRAAQAELERLSAENESLRQQQQPQYSDAGGG